MNGAQRLNRPGPDARRRAVVFGGVTALAIVLVGCLTLTLGRLGVPLSELLSALLGGAEGKTAIVLEKLRGPRLVTALCAGALLGVSGALFQTVTRNPLGSPDVIGIGAGAGAGAALITFAIPGAPVSAGAVLGAAAAAALVYVSTGRGFRSPARTIIAGIGVAALAFAITQYLVSTELREAATQLAAYLVGSLNAAHALDAVVTLAAVTVLLPFAALISRDVSLLEMGDEAAAGLGVQPERTRSLAVVLSVLAAGAAVSAVGPVAFVALTAPQISRRIIGTADVCVGSSALTGAFTLALADLATQQVPLFSGLPVGVLTLGVGGAYLGYLLVREHAKGRL